MKYIDAEKITAEIERMMEEEMSFFNEAVSNGEAEISASPVVYTRLQMLLSFIDSLPAEPASKDLEEEIKRYQQEIYDRDTTVKDIARHFAKWGKKQAEIEIQAQSMALAHGCSIEEPVKKQQEILHDCKTCKENDDSLTYSESEDLEKEIQRHLKDCLDIKFPTTDIESIKKDVEFTARYFAKWQKEQFEKNRLAACDAQTKEEAEREMDFVTHTIKEEHRQPTYSDAINYGMRLQKDLMIKDAIDATKVFSGIGSNSKTGECVPYTEYKICISDKQCDSLDKVKIIIIKEE